MSRSSSPSLSIRKSTLLLPNANPIAQTFPVNGESAAFAINSPIFSAIYRSCASGVLYVFGGVMLFGRNSLILSPDSGAVFVHYSFVAFRCLFK